MCETAANAQGPPPEHVMPLVMGDLRVLAVAVHRFGWYPNKAEQSERFRRAEQKAKSASPSLYHRRRQKLTIPANVNLVKATLCSQLTFLFLRVRGRRVGAFGRPDVT